jgi:hypothetical protein
MPYNLANYKIMRTEKAPMFQFHILIDVLTMFK